MSGSVSAAPAAPPNLPPQLLAALAAQRGTPPAAAPMPPQGGQSPAAPSAGIPPQLLQQMMAQAAASHTPAGAPPAPLPGNQGPPQAQAPQVPPRLPPPGAAQPGMAAFARAAQGGPPPNAQPRLTAAEMAALGRHGDSVVAHLTPGEIAIPRELQTPQVMAAIGEATGRFGVSPLVLQAGSPHAPKNPHTGAEEHSFWSALLPAVAMGATAFFAPELLPALGMADMGALGGAALVGGSGFLSSLATGASPLQAALTGAGGALGAGLGGIGSAADGAAGATSAADEQAINQAAERTAADALPTPPIPPSSASLTSNTFGTPAAFDINTGAALSNPYAGYPTAPGASPTGLSGVTNSLGLSGQTAANGTWLNGTSDLGGVGRTVMGGMLGNAVGSYFDPSTGTGTASGTLPASYTTPMAPLNTNYGQMLGSNQTIRPTFVNYDPTKSVTQAGYTFFPQQSAGNPAVPAVAAPTPQVL